MNLLLDTTILLWATGAPHRLWLEALELIRATESVLLLSAASLCGIAIKQGLGRSDFFGLRHDFCGGVCSTMAIPSLHNDPFDRMLVAQAVAEGFTLVTADKTVDHYPGSVRLV